MTTATTTRLYTVAEVAELLGTSPDSVRLLIARGQLRSVRFGPAAWHRVPVEEVERLIAGR